MDPRERPRIPATLWLSLAFCLALPPLWNALLPSHRGAPESVLLTPPHPADELGLPSEPIVARLVDRPAAQHNARAFAFELDRPGRFTVYGLSSHVATVPLVLRIDGERISTHAFDAETGSRHRDFLRQRIATGIRLGRGRHEVELVGDHLDVRSFALELWPEVPLGPLRYLMLASVAGLGLLARRVPVGWTLRPRTRLAVTAAWAVLPAALTLLATDRIAGPRLVTLDRGDLAKRGRLADFESQIAALAQREDDGSFDVAVLGDSTHYWNLDPRDSMRPAIERALPPGRRSRIRVFGVASQAFSAFDYYLLVNRLVDTPTDLIVIPVNARSFGERWISSAEHGFTAIERYLRLDELPCAPTVAVGDRETGWERVLLRRLDHALTGGRTDRLLRGLRLSLTADLDLAAREALPDWLLQQPAPPPERVWPDRIPPDHPLLAYFRAIDRLAAQHGIRVLYYTVQVNLDALAEDGIRVDLPGLYADVESELARAPGVDFLNLARDNPRWIFSDRGDHLNARGIRSVAARLAARIARIEREARD